jgi:hypothetical protein
MDKKLSNAQLNNWLYERVVNDPSKYYPCKYDPSFYYNDHKLKDGKNPEPRKGTRMYEANNIFKELVDHCFKFALYEDDGTPIVSVTTKKGFLKYVYEHSNHS